MKPTAPAVPLRRWLDWQQPATITEDSAKPEPTKPSKPRFVGFEGSLPGDLGKIYDSGEPSEPGIRPSHRIESAIDSATATERVMSWAEWKASALNRLFLEQGTSGQPGRITAETVLHGEQMSGAFQQRHRGGRGRNDVRL